MSLVHEFRNNVTKLAVWLKGMSKEQKHKLDIHSVKRKCIKSNQVYTVKDSKWMHTVWNIFSLSKASFLRKLAFPSQVPLPACC